MQACMSRLAALLAPVSGAVPRLLSRRFCADTAAVQLHALQLLQLIYELPDSVLLHRTAVAQLYVQYHHQQFVLYYQGSAANPDSAAAELAWMQLQVGMLAAFLDFHFWGEHTMLAVLFVYMCVWVGIRTGADRLCLNARMPCVCPTP